MDSFDIPWIQTISYSPGVLLFVCSWSTTARGLDLRRHVRVKWQKRRHFRHKRDIQIMRTVCDKLRGVV